jgi:uncharacterized protein (TIGR03084 family)
MSNLDHVRSDLLAEQHSLDVLVATIDEAQWHLATASPGWTVSDQIGHLAYFDEAARTAILSPERFRASVHELLEGARHHGIDDFTLATFRAMTPAQLLATWRENRRALAEAAQGLDETTRVEWYGPSMGATSFLTARLMETWAHGTDVADALGTTLPATDRLRHIAQLGYITRKWSYQVRGEEPPPGRVRVRLMSPSGAEWSWGDEDADDKVSGSAEDFCLVVTQRRHLDDTNLVAGDLARHWLLRAQAFAGGPSDGPTAKGRDGTR